MEFGELDIFLRRNEDYKPFEDERTLLRAEPIGVPGAYSPLQMHPKHAPSRSPSPSPLALPEKKKEIVAGEAFAEFGLQDASVSMDELKALVEELGLGGDDADDLVKGLAGDSSVTEKSNSAEKGSIKVASSGKNGTATIEADTKKENTDPSPVRVSPPEETETNDAATPETGA